MITLLAHNLPPVSISQTDESGAPLLLRLTHPNHKVQTLIVHSHPTTLHLFNNNKLQSAWSFPHPIVAYCSNTSSNSSHQKQRPLQLEDNGITLVVATQDGSIWNVPLQSPALDSNTTNSSSSGNIKSSTNQTSKSLPKIAIKIEDDDTIVIKDEDEEEEEVELWNDEDGLVVDEAFDALETLLPPANKRQRISSPPIVTTTPHDTAESSYKTHTVNRAHHLIGSESNISHIVFLAKDLLIFRHDEGPIRWTSHHQFAPQTEITRQPIPMAHKLQAVARLSECLNQKSKTGDIISLFIATKSCLIYRITIKELILHVNELFKVKDSVASIFTTPRNTLSHGHKLLVIGTNGVISWSEIPEYVQDSFPVAPKSLSLDTNAQHAFITRTHLYILNEIGQVVRLPTEQLELTTSKDLEIMSLPLLCALSPITSHDSRSFDGLYGLKRQGSLLTFPVDWTGHARPQRLVETRETVGRALSELERLSDQIKQLEVQCQLENQRITTYNRLVFELQQSVLTSTFSLPTSRQDIHHEDIETENFRLLVETSLSTFSLVVANNFVGTRRFYARLKVVSKANIDWSRGWSVGLNVTSKVEFCPHGKPKISIPRRRRSYYQTFASLQSLSRKTPWTLDFELDREMVSSLPLQVSIGLLFREFEHDRTSMTIAKEEGIFSAYFVVDDLDLDILDFVEGVEDPLLYEIPAPVQRLPSFPSTAITNTTLHYNNKSLDNSNDGHNDEGQEEEKSCVQCTNENGNLFGPDIKAATSHASAFQPIEFEIDTASIPPSQCLSALFFQEDNEISCRKSIKVIDMTALRRTTISTTTAIATVTTTQACFRTCFILPGECLSSFRRASAVCHYFGPTTQQQRQQQHQQTRHQQPYNPGKRFNTVDELKRQVSWRTSEEILVAADQIEDSEFKMVWVDLEVEQLSNKDRDEENKRKGLHQAQDYTKQQHQQQQMQQPQEEHEGLVRAHVLVRGSDPERVFAVHQTLEKRIHELF